jgi:hypothetical protein
MIIEKNINQLPEPRRGEITDKQIVIIISSLRDSRKGEAFCYNHDIPTGLKISEYNQKRLDIGNTTLNYFAYIPL